MAISNLYPGGRGGRFLAKAPDQGGLFLLSGLLASVLSSGHHANSNKFASPKKAPATAAPAGTAPLVLQHHASDALFRPHCVPTTRTALHTDTNSKAWRTGSCSRVQLPFSRTSIAPSTARSESIEQPMTGLRINSATLVLNACRASVDRSFARFFTPFLTLVTPPPLW